MRISERTCLQIAVALACIVPISAGLGGMIRGVALLGVGTPSLDSHMRYLSGLLLGIGLGYLTTIPHIESYRARFRLLTQIVVIGGLGRLLGVFLMGFPSREMLAALVMELIVTPLLYLWQQRVARNFGGK